MRRRRGLSAASKILGRGASSSPPPSQFPCLRTTPTTLTRSTMSTPCSAQSGRTRALAPQGRPWPLDRSKVNHAWFLFVVSPPIPLPLTVSLLFNTDSPPSSVILPSSLPPHVLPSLCPSVWLCPSPRLLVRLGVFWRLCDLCLLTIRAVPCLVQ